MRIGLLGGTFDPVHAGHLAMAQTAQRVLRLQRILFAPARCPWQKSQVQAGFSHRFAMLALALQGHPAWLPVDLAPQRPLHPTYSLDEVAAVRALHPRAELYFILGADAWAQVGTWKHSRRLLAACDFIVLGRRGFDAGPAAGSSHESLPGGRLLHRVAFDVPISSTAARRALAAAPAAPAARLVPAPVREYARRAGLYRQPAPSSGRSHG